MKPRKRTMGRRSAGPAAAVAWCAVVIGTVWPHLCIMVPCASASASAFASSPCCSNGGKSLTAAQRHAPSGQGRAGRGGWGWHRNNNNNQHHGESQQHPLGGRKRTRAYTPAPLGGGGGGAAAAIAAAGGEGGLGRGGGGEGGAATGRLALRGPIFDLLTPFTEEGEVDFIALGKYLQFLSKAGVQTVLCNGETGEFASLTTDERRLLVEFTREAFAGTVLNHVSASALPDVTRLISHSSGKSSGGSRTVADAVLVMPPHSSFGGFQDERGTEAFLRKALKGCRLPVFLYSAAGNPISPGLYARLCADFPTVSGILDGSGDTARSSELKEALPARQLLVCAENGSAGMGGGDPRSDGDALLTSLKSGADACVTGASSPLPELAVRMQSCFDRGDAGGAAQAQRRLNVWTKKRAAMSSACSSTVPLVKAAVAARVPGLQAHTRPPYEDLEAKQAAGLMRWVSNNDDVVREKQNAHIKRVSGQLAEVYQRTWNNVEVAGLEMVFKQLSSSEDRLLSYLDRARQERAELNGRSIMNASTGEAHAAKLLSNVMDARRRLEEDAAGNTVAVTVDGGGGGGGETAALSAAAAAAAATPAASTGDAQSGDGGSAAAGLRVRLEEAMAVAEESKEHLSGLNGLSGGDAFGVQEIHGSGSGGGHDGNAVPLPAGVVAQGATGGGGGGSGDAVAVGDGGSLLNCNVAHVMDNAVAHGDTVVGGGGGGSSLNGNAAHVNVNDNAATHGAITGGVSVGIGDGRILNGNAAHAVEHTGADGATAIGGVGVGGDGDGLLNGNVAHVIDNAATTGGVAGGGGGGLLNGNAAHFTDNAVTHGAVTGGVGVGGGGCSVLNGDAAHVMNNAVTHGATTGVGVGGGGGDSLLNGDAAHVMDNAVNTGGVGVGGGGDGGILNGNAAHGINNAVTHGATTGGAGVGFGGGGGSVLNGDAAHGINNAVSHGATTAATGVGGGGGSLLNGNAAHVVDNAANIGGAGGSSLLNGNAAHGIDNAVGHGATTATTDVGGGGGSLLNGNAAHVVDNAANIGGAGGGSLLNGNAAHAIDNAVAHGATTGGDSGGLNGSAATPGVANAVPVRANAATHSSNAFTAAAAPGGGGGVGVLNGNSAAGVELSVAPNAGTKVGAIPINGGSGGTDGSSSSSSSSSRINGNRAGWYSTAAPAEAVHAGVGVPGINGSGSGNSNNGGGKSGLNGFGVSRSSGGKVGMEDFGAISFGGVPEREQQQEPVAVAAPVADFMQGPTYAGLDYQPDMPPPQHGRVPPEDDFSTPGGQEQQQQQQPIQQEQDLDQGHQQQQSGRQDQQLTQQQQSRPQQQQQPQLTRQQQQKQQQQEHLYTLLEQHQQHQHQQHQESIGKYASSVQQRPSKADDNYDPFENLRMFGPTATASTTATTSTTAPEINGNSAVNGYQRTPLNGSGSGSGGDDDGDGKTTSATVKGEGVTAVNGVAAAPAPLSGSGSGSATEMTHGGQEQGALNGSGTPTDAPKDTTRSYRKKLPAPRYGRYIPEGSPPREKAPAPAPTPSWPAPAPTSYSSVSSFVQGEQDPRPASPPPTPPPQHFTPYPGSTTVTTTAFSASGLGRNTAAAGEAAPPAVAGGEGAAGLNEATLDGRGERGAGAATPTQRRNGEGVREGGGQAGKFGGPVDDFREKEKETFFKSKGIEGDVDSFNWDDLRRNTVEIEQLQKQAVDRYWQERGGNPNDINTRYPRR